jgi:hypothetical protein
MRVQEDKQALRFNKTRIVFPLCAGFFGFATHCEIFICDFNFEILV